MPSLPYTLKDSFLQRANEQGVLWTPRLLTDRALVFDMLDRSSMSIVAGTAAVSAIRDTTGAGSIFTQATQSNMPTYTGSGLKFTAASSQSLSDSNPQLGSAFSAAIFLTENGSTNTQEPFYNGSSNANGWGFMNNWVTDPNKMQAIYGGAVVLKASATRTAGVRAMQYLGRSGSTTYEVDGVAYSVSATGPVLPATVGRMLGASFAPTATAFYDGTIHGLVCLKRAMTVDERRKLQGFWAWVHGVNTRLASTHPYRYYPPLIGPVRPGAWWYLNTAMEQAPSTSIVYDTFSAGVQDQNILTHQGERGTPWVRG